MTIASQDFRFEYVSTGGTTYPYTNKILASTDLVVYVDDVLQTEGSDYSVTDVGEAAGGNVVFGVAPAVGATVLLVKDGVQFTQDTDYVENDSFPAESHEDALDKLTNLAQKIWDYTRRSVKLPVTSSLTDLSVPDGVANAVIGWDAAGTALENKVLTGYGLISDSTYSSAWNGQATVAPSQNAAYDIIAATLVTVANNTASCVTNAANIANNTASVAGLVSNDAYGVGWSGVTAVAPSKDAVYDKIQTLSSSYPRGHIDGFRLVNNAIDPTNDIDLNAGQCRDSVNSVNIDLTAAMTKQADASWAAGTGAGGLFSGDLSANTWKHVFIIVKDDGTTDAGFSASVTAADRPSGYSAYRRVGSIRIDGDPKIQLFVQKGDEFLWESPVLDINVTNPGSSAITRTVSVPIDVICKARLNVLSESGGGEYAEVYFSSLDCLDMDASGSAAPLASIGQSVAAGDNVCQVQVWTDTSAQFRTRHKGTGSGTYFVAATYGWHDMRGRNA